MGGAPAHSAQAWMAPPRHWVILLHCFQRQVVGFGRYCGCNSSLVWLGGWGGVVRGARRVHVFVQQKSRSACQWQDRGVTAEMSLGLVSYCINWGAPIGCYWSFVCYC